MPRALSEVAKEVQASTTLAIDSIYKKMKSEGIDVIGFGTGEPDFHTPVNIKEAAVQAIEQNFTYYTPASGTEDLRKAVCHRLKEDCGIEYKPTQVVVSNGAKQCLYLALRVLINPGDEVLLPSPYWVSYFEMIKMVGGVPVIIDPGAEAGWKITPEMVDAAVTAKTKAIIYNSPSNPSGIVYAPEEVEALADVFVKHDLYVIADEIYYKLLFDQVQFKSIAACGEAIKERTLLINGVSKSYAMTGWRIGYVLAPEPIAKLIGNYQSHASSGPNSIAQKAATAALMGPQEGIEAMRKEFEARRNYFLERVKDLPGIQCVYPEGAFYVMMDISAYVGRTIHGKLIKDGDDFANLFLEKGLVAVVPCSGFGAPNCVRWSYATSMQNIKTGLDRLELFLK